VTIDLPLDVLAMRDRGDDWAAWVDRLPALARDLLDEWDLTVDGALMNGFCSLVVPVLTADRERSVLKLHTDADADESDFEHLALQHWHGNGTVLLLRADPRRRAMLLERLHPRDLTTIGDREACEVVGGLYGRIHVPALPQLRTITSYVERWTADLEALPRDAPIPRRLREQCVSLVRDLVADPASVGVIIHGDLHHGNLLLRDGALHVVDFDDMVVGPAVQDLWLALPGRDGHTQTLRERFLEGYLQFRDFDRSALPLIETLRAMRIIHYAAWLARRWHDPAFPAAWPQFGTPEYWERETQDLEEQLAVIRGEATPEEVAARPEEETAREEEEALTNKDFFWDWEGE